MDLLQLLQGLMGSIAELQAKLQDAEAQLAIEKKASYDAGFADGVASVVVDPEKKFSQADLDKAVSDAVLPLQDQVAALQAQVDGLPSLVAEEVAKVKASLLASYEAQQVVENDSETGFKDLLK